MEWQSIEAICRKLKVDWQELINGITRGTSMVASNQIYNTILDI